MHHRVNDESHSETLEQYQAKFVAIIKNENHIKFARTILTFGSRQNQAPSKTNFRPIWSVNFSRKIIRTWP